MTIEEFIVAYLTTHLPVDVSGDVPSPRPDSFVTVEQTGSGMTNMIPSATVVIDSWAPTRAAAMTLNAQVEAAMEAMAAEPDISRSALNTSYNYPDLATKHPRYRASFSVVYLF